VPLLDLQDLPDGARVALVAMAGAPLPMLERFADADHFARPVAVLAAHLGVRFDAVAGFEIGSMNAIVPVLVAARTGLPMVDLDTLGRSFPQVHMSSFAIDGVDMVPLAISDLRPNDLVIESSAGGPWTETLVRTVATAFGSIVALAGCFTAAQLRAHAIAGTYSRALRIGSALLRAQARHEDPVAALIGSEGGVLMVRGRIRDVERRIDGGFVRGRFDVAPADGTAPWRVEFQNEYGLVSCDGRVRSSVPDLIAVFDGVRGEPLGAEALRYAQQIAVVSLPPMARHLEPRALAVVGPRGFGYDTDNVSVHQEAHP
jgi:DUF917 family protein